MKEFIKKLNAEQKVLLNKISSSYSDVDDIEDRVSDYLITNCFINNQEEVNEEGKICESILDLIGDM